MAVAVFAFSNRRWLIWLALGVIGAILLLVAVPMALVGGLAGSQAASVDGFGPSATAIDQIPPDYLTLYQQAGSEFGLDWTYLAAIGQIETNHGRLNAPGVKSGVNAYGCCSGPMQFSVVGNPSTWGTYGNGGNVFDPKDAIPAAARYLKASGAPGDWRKAIFSYNHSSRYVADVLSLAERFRGSPLSAGGPLAGSGISQALTGRKWLTPVAGSSATADSRIVPDIEMLMARYKMVPGDCYAPTGHASDGEHPLGLGCDFHPASGDWGLLGQAARDLGWRESCAASGCAGQMPSPIRFCGWNGYPGHGDPANAGGNAHLHLSWMHTPASPGGPAARVQTLLASKL